MVLSAHAHAWKLNIKPIEARLRLNQISKDRKVHVLFRGNAKLTLQEWDKGNIKPIL